jgi:hypothetical protein
MAGRQIELELDARLQREDIITKFVFDLNNQDIILELDHKYCMKRIVSPIEVGDWQYTIQTFKEAMEEQDVDQNHIRMICDVATNNATRLKETKNAQQQDKRTFTTYKYSFNFQGNLYEAVILAGKPVFISYDSKKVKVVKSIKEESRILTPPFQEEYAYRPYEFRNVNEISEYLERAKKCDIGSIFKALKPIVASYNDQTPEKQTLLAIDIIWSYFQDRFPTTRYNIVLGGNGSGKSAEAISFSAMGYRPVNLTNPNAANINRILGCIEPGQCTIISDETRGLEKNADLLSVLAEGYRLEGQTSKVNDYSRKSEYFKAYCYKIILAEKMPNLRELKGIVDRSFSETSYRGRPKYDIKETLTPQGNPNRQRRMNILNDFRKLMLIYRLIHFKNSIPDVNVGVEGREKELVKPNLQLFYGTSAETEVKNTLQFFLDKRRGKKDVSIEPILHGIVIELCDTQDTNELPVKDIWDKLKREIPGHTDVERDRDGIVIDIKRPNEYHTQDFGTIYCNSTVASVMEHTFGGTPKHNRNGNSYVFNREKLEKVSSSLTRNADRIQICEEDEQGEEDNEAFEPEPILYNYNYNYVNNNKRSQGSSPSSPLHTQDPDLEEVEHVLMERASHTLSSQQQEQAA